MTGTKKKFEHSTQEYRQLSGLNQSMLSVFDDDIGIFYRQFILGEPKDDKESSAMIIGSLVDFILLDCQGNFTEFEQRMHEKFAMFEGVRSSAQVFDLADELFKITARDTGSDGEVNTEFLDRMKEAFAIVKEREKYKGKTLEYAIKDFEEKGQEYFQAKIQNIGKIVVDQRQLEKAKHVAGQAQGDELLGAYINQQTDENVEIIKKHVIEFEIQARHQKWQCKMEQDETRIDHENGIIYRNDYKANYDNEEFEYAYLKRKYYLQNGFYHLGTKDWAKKNGYEGYSVEPMAFIVFDTSINSRRPLRYLTNEQHLVEAMNGFTYNGKRYRGISELIEGIDWANHNSIWNISKTNYGNKAIVPLKNYDN